MISIFCLFAVFYACPREEWNFLPTAKSNFNFKIIIATRCVKNESFFWKGQMKSSCAQPLFVIYRRSQKNIRVSIYKYARSHCPIVASCSEQDGIECWNLENLIVIHNEFSFWLRESSAARVFIECCLTIVKRKSVNWGELGSNIMCRKLFIVRNIFFCLHFFIFLFLNWRWLCPTDQGDQAINDGFAHVRNVVQQTQQIELFELSSKRFCSVLRRILERYLLC